MAVYAHEAIRRFKLFKESYDEIDDGYLEFLDYDILACEESSRVWEGFTPIVHGPMVCLCHWRRNQAVSRRPFK